MERGKTKSRKARAGRKILLDGKAVKAARFFATGRELLAALRVSPQEALIKVDGKMRPEAFPLEGAKKIEIIRVVFGG